MAYDVKPIAAPRAAGTQLRLLSALVENPFSGSLLGRVLLGNAGVLALRASASEDGLPCQALVYGTFPCRGGRRLVRGGHVVVKRALPGTVDLPCDRTAAPGAGSGPPHQSGGA